LLEFSKKEKVKITQILMRKSKTANLSRHFHDFLTLHKNCLPPSRNKNLKQAELWNLSSFVTRYGNGRGQEKNAGFPLIFWLN